MLTIFTIPKAFIGTDAIHQENAIASWLSTIPNVEVFLFGNEVGVDTICEKYGIKHFPDIRTTQFGTPLLSDAFQIAFQKSSANTLCYINTDIITTSSFLKSIKQLNFPQFFAIGIRTDLDLFEHLNFQNRNWEQNLIVKVRHQGKLGNPAGSDYFIFSKGSNLHSIPDFAVGRPGWDNWFIYQARRKKLPVIDLTNDALVIHQNHHHLHVPDRRGKTFHGPEGDQNYLLAGEFALTFTLRDCTWRMVDDKLKRNLSRYYISRYIHTYPYLYPEKAYFGITLGRGLRLVEKMLRLEQVMHN